MPDRRTVFGFLAALLVAVPAIGDAGADPPWPQLMELAPSPSEEALDAIPDPGRRLLALRSYIRAGSGLAERWSWTDKEIEAYRGSAEQRALLAEVDAVSAHFADANPGYEIYVNTKVRSLDIQIERWNSNESVGAASVEILAAWNERFGTGDLTPDEDGLKIMRNWLSGFRGETRSNLAAPGLTAHGQAHAIDFQVMKDGEIIAGADSGQIESVWRAEGWDVKLKDSMEAAGPSFTGPLVSPDEPWHYHYDPEVPSVP